MAHLLQHKQIDKAAWDACIEASVQGQVYALSWYLDVVSKDWQALVEQVDGKYVAVMPLPVRYKYGYSYLQQPLFCQQLGIYSRNKLTTEQITTFLDLVQKQYRYTSGYTFNTANSGPLQAIVQPDSYRLLYTHYLPLNPPYEQIWKGYTRDRKYNLNKARRERIRVVQSNDIEPLVQLFKQNVAQKIYGGVADEAYQMLRQLFTALVEKGTSELLYTVSEDGDITAGGLFIFFRGYIIYIFNAANAVGRKQNGRTLLIDDIIQRNAETKQVFDFESPMVESIASFYQSFGSQPMPYYEWHYNQLPLPARLFKNIRKQLLLFFIKQK
ncbi:GNAT family N-acetyltransferase [Pontibacter rugosus]|uniref:GNAT family N-acetyltransferase n=1 Tax=Pontibacter rugosus TaxID=1745966 RepID=A0ABW3SUH3_9BACT